MAKFGTLAAIVPTVTTNIGTKSGAIQNVVTGGPAGYADNWRPNIIDDPASGTCRLDVSTGGNLGAEIIYDFGQPVSVGALRYGGSTNAPFGRWQLYGSQDGAIWSQIGYETAPRFGVGGIPNTGYGDIPSMQLPYRVLDWMTAGGGYTLDLDQPPYWWTNTLFFRYFKLVGVESSWPSFPVDGNASLPPYVITLLDLVAAERRRDENPLIIPGQAEVWAGPLNTAYLGPDDGSNGTPQGGGGTGGGGPTTPGDDDDPPPPPPPPPSDYFHPYSRGVRGKKYNPTTEPGSSGNGVTAEFSQTNPPTIFAGPESGVNYNFGASAGDGPYLGGDVPVGFRFEFTFPTPVILTGLLGVNRDANDNHFGTWKLVAFDAGSWRDIGDPEDCYYPPNATLNSRWGNAKEFLIRGGADVVTSTRFGLQYVGGTTGGRVINEWVFKLANSKLQGGDRRRVFTDKDYVFVSSNFSLSHSASGAVTSDTLQDIVNSVIGTSNGGLDGDAVTTAPVVVGPGTGLGRTTTWIRFNNSNDPAGSYFQFEFARGVVIRYIQPNFNGQYEELDGSNNPTKWGTWKMQWADNPAGPFTDVGEEFNFGNRAWAPFCDIQNDEGNPHSYWRLTKVSGNQQTGGGVGISQLNFLLEDIGERTAYPINFTDDDGFDAVVTITEPAVTDPGEIHTNFVDETVFSVNVTLKFNLHLSADFNDEAVLDVFSELSPSIITQTVVHQTGRI